VSAVVLLAALGAVVIFGGSAVATKVAVSGIGAIDVAILRTVIGGALALPLTLLSRIYLPQTRAQLLLLLLSGFCGFIAFPLLSIANIEIERENAIAAEVAAREALQRIQATLPDTYVEGVARCLVGISLEQQGNIAEGSPLVESSHALIMKRDVLVPTYQELCRVPDNK